MIGEEGRHILRRFEPTAPADGRFQILERP
jgi:hypothetical protein